MSRRLSEVHRDVAILRQLLNDPAATLSTPTVARSTSFESPTTIGISACLLGHKVAYHGGAARKIPAVLGAAIQLSKSHRHLLRFVAYCPEVCSGLSVPRPPLKLLDVDNATRVCWSHDGQVVESVSSWLLQSPMAYSKDEIEAPAIHGFIGQGRSPMCGVADARIYARHDDMTNFALGDGAFVQCLQRRAVPCISSRRLKTNDDFADFYEKVLLRMINYVGFFFCNT